MQLYVITANTLQYNTSTIISIKETANEAYKEANILQAFYSLFNNSPNCSGTTIFEVETLDIQEGAERALAAM